MNVSPEDYNRYLEILELSPKASLSEIRSSYLYLRALYSSDSIVTSAIAHEFPEDDRRGYFSR